jgi:hypothetical protein
MQQILLILLCTVKLYNFQVIVFSLRTAIAFLKYFLLACLIWLPIFSLLSNEQELGTEIDPGMAMTPFPSSILDRDLNSQPYNLE